MISHANKYDIGRNTRKYSTKSVTRFLILTSLVILPDQNLNFYKTYYPLKKPISVKISELLRNSNPLI
jgi:Na+-transporting NADH:ubiquinone oxidoreductase subunit NqrD